MTVHAVDADCNPRYGQKALVHITVSDAQDRKVIMTTVPMNDAGGFTYHGQIDGLVGAANRTGCTSTLPAGQEVHPFA